MELAELIAIFFISVQCLTSAVVPADDNRSLGMSKSRLFLIWSFILCVWRQPQILILKNQTAWTASPTNSLTGYIQYHSHNVPILLKKIRHWQVNLIMLGVNTHPLWLLGPFWGPQVWHTIFFLCLCGWLPWDASITLSKHFWSMSRQRFGYSRGLSAWRN